MALTNLQIKTSLAFGVKVKVFRSLGSWGGASADEVIGTFRDMTSY